MILAPTATRKTPRCALWGRARVVVVLTVGCASIPQGPSDGAPRDAVSDVDYVDTSDLDGDVESVVDVLSADVVAGDTADATVLPCGAPRPDLSRVAPGVNWRFGGGIDYPDHVRRECATVTVADRARLTMELGRARAGGIVYVDDDAVLDFTGLATPLCIPAGVTVASGRGRAGSAGALLFRTDATSRPMLTACGDGTRITGLRILGPDPLRCPTPSATPGCTSSVPCRDCSPTAVGITTGDLGTGRRRMEIDNCELAGWSLSAVRVQTGTEHSLHHSDVHHNQRDGLGYGVLLSSNGSATDIRVAACLFDRNRHAIAGSGGPNQSYESQDNLARVVTNGWIFDMHGIDESAGSPNPEAGARLLYHGNIVLPTSTFAVVVRGRPTIGAWIFDNCFARTSATSAVDQRNNLGNFFVDRSPSGPAPNRYGQSATSCGVPPRFCALLAGHGPPMRLEPSPLGVTDVVARDFDGDGRADLLRTTGTEWQWRRSGQGPWVRRNMALETLASLRFGDFDGDGAIDVLHATGVEWRMSSGGQGAWVSLRSTPDRLDIVALGDFVGDRRTDVFSANGTEWRVSDAARSAYARLRAATESLSVLSIGQFDADPRDDVFHANGSVWRVSSGGLGAWRTLRADTSLVDSLAFADVTGDHRTDVITRDTYRWYVNDGGDAAEALWSITSESFATTRFADFDGDGREDALVADCL